MRAFTGAEPSLEQVQDLSARPPGTHGLGENARERVFLVPGLEIPQRVAGNHPAAPRVIAGQ